MGAENGNRRYNPNIHSALAYIKEAGGNWAEHYLRRNLVLGGLFTPLAEKLHDKIMLHKKHAGLPVPEKLSGDEPRLLRVPLTKFSEYDGLSIKEISREYRSGGHKADDGGEFSSLDIIIPVGAYGDHLAYSLTQATRALYTIMPVMIKKDAGKLYEMHPIIINRYTYWTDPLTTMFDSINSVGQAFALLTADKRNPHYPNDPVGLFRKFIEEKTFNQYADHLVLRRQAEKMIRGGIAFADGIDPNTFKLTPELRKYLQDEQKKRRKFIQGWKGKVEKETGYGCPVALENTPVKRGDGKPDVIKDSGINLVAMVFVEYLEHYYKKPQVKV